jgi:hypothetical protein
VYIGALLAYLFIVTMQNMRCSFLGDRTNQGDYVVIINGTDDQLGHAGLILSRYRIQEWQIYDQM